MWDGAREEETSHVWDGAREEETLPHVWEEGTYRTRLRAVDMYKTTKQ